jgi:hypothetical protein
VVAVVVHFDYYLNQSVVVDRHVQPMAVEAVPVNRQLLVVVVVVVVMT